ncbi:hypothetical protein HDU92_003977 [Lobulomyces angularis]|nr:hypothetical protein HDU92_003977 [Lobulomyces angularis]
MTIKKKKLKSTSPEFYGFIIYIVSYFTFAVYLLWAIIPDSVLNLIGITYYPQKQWAIIIPIYILGLIPFISFMIIGINLTKTFPLDSLNTITDEFQKYPDENDLLLLKDPNYKPYIADLPLDLVNKSIFECPLQKK